MGGAEKKEKKIDIFGILSRDDWTDPFLPNSDGRAKTAVSALTH